ncbi:MAG: glycosyltransferase [Desulfovibrio sp.]
MKISVITPCWNAVDCIEKSIQSVLKQDYDDWEHIVIDGASTDGTQDVLKKYSHLKWISEPDGGQVDAMNKGFERSTGDVVVYLNADDYFYEGAFSAAVKAFKKDTVIVFGKVDVYDGKNDCWWENDPKTDLRSMLRHWELNAFCYNPVGYFYKKEIQTDIALNTLNDDKHDLEFLLLVAQKYPKGIQKSNHKFGVYNDTVDTKTARNQQSMQYWRNENFSFIDDIIADMDSDFVEAYNADRACGYQLQTHWTIKDTLKRGDADRFYKAGEIIPFPCDEHQLNHVTMFSERSHLLAKRDAVVCILSAGKVGTQSLAHSLRASFGSTHAYPVYDLHLFDPSNNIQERLTPRRNGDVAHRATSTAVHACWDKHCKDINWKFIAGVREPISWMISAYFQNNETGMITSSDDFFEKCTGMWKWISGYFDLIYKRQIGVDIYDYEFDKDRKYGIVQKDNVEILLYRLESLSATCTDFVGEFLGIRNFHLKKANEASKKSYAKNYSKTLKILEKSFSQEQLKDIYEHPFVKHFYTDAEIEKFYKKWSQKKTLSCSSTDSDSSKKTDNELFPYQKRFLDALEEQVPVVDKRILEIGSDPQFAIGRQLLNDGAGAVQCSNMIDYTANLQNHHCKGLDFMCCDGRRLPFEDGEFDLVIGCALLEHINDVDLFFSELNRVLKPGGKAFMHGEPLWHSAKGHHLYLVRDGMDYRFNEESNPVPDFAHITHTADELYDVLRADEIPSSHAKDIVKFIYETDLMSRNSAKLIRGCFDEHFETISDIRFPKTPLPKTVATALTDAEEVGDNLQVASLILFGEKI